MQQLKPKPKQTQVARHGGEELQRLSVGADPRNAAKAHAVVSKVGESFYACCNLCCWAVLPRDFPAMLSVLVDHET